jgi:ABC-type branched-subunit amino acid transport system substrate-binding protein
MTTHRIPEGPAHRSPAVHRFRRSRAAAVVAGAAALAMLAACSSGGSAGDNGSSSSTSSAGGGPAASSQPNTASGDAPAGGEIKLGISVPLSGSVGSSCGPMNKAMLAWFDHVNQQGGVNGAKISADTRDDGYTAARAVTSTEAVIQEKGVGETGQCGSIQPPAQVPLVDAAKIPYLFVFGASTKLLNPLSPMYFNLMPAYGEQLVAAIPWVFEKYGKGTVAIVSTSTPDAPTTDKAVKEAVEKAGAELADTLTAPPGTADFTPYVLKLKDKAPDYVVLDMTPQDGARLTEAMTANGFSPNKYLLGSSAVSQQAFLDGVSKALQPKLLVTSDVIAPADAGSTECATVLKAAKVDVTSVTLRGCGTAQVVVKALQEAGSPVTSQGIVDAIEKWNDVKASEIYPPVSFSHTSHVGVKDLFIFGVKDGTFEQVGSLGA